MSGDVVVVDDEPGTLKLLKTLLENDGHEVRAFTNGALALRSIGVKAPDLVMLDIRMPGLNGFEFCEKLKVDPGSAAIPVIFLSAATDIDDKIAAFAVGGVDYITKPFEKAEVLARVETHVSLSRARQELESARRLSAASADSMLDPQVLLEAVRDSSGNIVDFTYREVNKATCDYLGLAREDLLGRGVVETMPGIEATLLPSYIRCLESGQPLVLNDFSYDNEILLDTRRYDIQATRSTPNSITLTWRDVTERFQAAQRALAAQTLLHATVDSMLNPQSLLEAVRDRAGHVVDFVYRSANRAFCSYRGGEEREIIGTSLVEAQPSLVSSGLFARYVNCVDTGESVVLDDFDLLNVMLGENRRFDIRVVRAGVDLVSLTFSDVTARYQAAQRISASERSYRLLAENSSDMVAHVRDGRFVWISPSVAGVLGGSPDYWVGREMRETVPPQDLPEFAANFSAVMAGGVVKGRVRVNSVDGVTHWAHVHGKPYCDDEGHQDGLSIAVRLIDDEVAAEQASEEARRKQARADALYRRSVDSAAVGMCLADLEGNFIEANQALCEYFGYDAVTLRQMTWQELTDPDYLEADLDNRAQVLAGEIESYRMVKKFIHADGHPIWGDLAVSCIRDEDGHVEVFIGQIADITAEVQAREQLEQARRDKQRDDERYRRSIDNAAVGMCMVTLDGRLYEINDAGCRFFGYDAQKLNGTGWQDVTAPEYLEDEQTKWNDLVEGRIESYRMVKHYRHADGHLIWGDLSVSGVRDDEGKLEHIVALITDVTAEMQAREQLEKQNELIAASEETYRLLVENVADVVAHVRDGRFVWMSSNVAEISGLPAEYWLGVRRSDLIAGEVATEFAAEWKALSHGESGSLRTRVNVPGSAPHWVQISGKPYFDSAGRRDGELLTIRRIDDQVAAEQAMEEVRRAKEEADAIYRRSMSDASLAMVIATPEGRIQEANESMCRMAGIDAQTLIGMHWTQFPGVPSELAEQQKAVDDIAAGTIDSYRMLRTYFDPNGRTIWGDMSITGIRGEGGRLEFFIITVSDVTARVEADDRNRALAQQLQQQTDRVKAELDSAASYMSSLMPRGLQGPVTVSSRYLPSRELGGDCLDYYWIDDDHLLLKLIDVSGHGIEPALLAVSVHNLMRSGSIARETLLSPVAVLTELNRLFAMEQQKDHYFTIWYGVYEPSTRTLRYASAGSTPALAFNSPTGNAVTSTALFTPAAPVGVFEDTVFTSRTYHVPPGCRMLIYSDGASEITLADGHQFTGAAFKNLTSRVAASPDWSLDDLIDELRALTPAGHFEDDCSLIRVAFD